MAIIAPPPGADLVVVGGGLIGLASAWRCAQQGLRPVVVDPKPGRGASYAAAGMLAPVTEAHFGEEELLALNLAASERYPAFVSEVEQRSGLDAGFRTCGTLLVALDEGDRAVVARLAAFQASLGLSVEVLSGRDCRALEPMLAPGVRAGLHAPEDHQVDNRRLHSALLAAAAADGVRIVSDRVVAIQTAGGRVSGLTLADGSRIGTERVVLAAGAWTADIAGLPPEAVPPVRPVKGQILRLQVPAAYAPFLSRTVRGVARGHDVYLVPRADGELVVGATVEEQGFDTQVTAGGVYELLRDARALLPGVVELPLVQALAGLRPGSPDNAPLIGPSTVSGLVLATGHFRNGVLLTPVTADAVAQLVVTGQAPPVVRPFSPLRLSERRVSEEVPA